MTAKEINKRALDCLSSQNWKMAQELFYKNARENPSHETYNNLGNYLIHEGFNCRNGKVRSAKKLGMKYLQNAAKIGVSSTNLCAIAKACDFELRRTTGCDKTLLYQTMYESLVASYSIEPTNETMYNILRMQMLTEAHDETIIDNIKNLIAEFVCEESVRLYFEILRSYSLYYEGLRCIMLYGKYISEDDLMLFYAKYQQYDKGYDLCKTVCDQYSPDKYISAAVIECCINTNHLEHARLYAKYAVEVEKSISYAGKENWCDQVFSNLSESTALRKELISKYISIPPYMNTSCYFSEV